jgi:Ca2+-binding RTX toxin-like protein
MRIDGTGVHDTRHGTAVWDEIYGYGGDDTLYGGGGGDHIYGGDGVDHLYGGSDRDYLYGGNDDDFLYGGDGDDYLNGMHDNDWLNGGDGADDLDGGDDVYLLGHGGDTAAYGDSDATVFVSLATGRGFGGDAEHDTLVNIENLSGSRFGDLLVGDDQNNKLSGLGGDDSLLGGQGVDQLEGGEGNDTLNGGGNDPVVIGYYADELTGGPGADKFVFSSIDDIGNSTIAGRASDLITDFNRAEGDQINLHPIDADERASAPGNQDFSTVLVPEGSAFTAPGQISWQHHGGETWILLNTDADLSADATIQISGSHTPDVSWFIF